jgi:hypothetical protein
MQFMKYGSAGMGTRLTMRWGAALLVLAAPGAYGQTTAATGPGMRILTSPPVLAQAPAGGEIVREIDDPNSGARWLLERNPDHPGGPGLLVLVESGRNPVRQDQSGFEPSGVDPRTVIRAGDRLIVEENTPVVEARLEAIALGTAVLGSVLEARLKIGGRVVRAVALGPGRAELQPQTEARP